MEHSHEIAELATALAKAQGDIEGASKDSANPFFKSKYADLASVWDACRKPLSAAGLAIVQSPSVETSELGPRVSVETLLLHASGQWMRNVVSALAKEDAPQAIGSCITYLRRYALQSVVGVAPEDDDGEAAQGRNATMKTAVLHAAPKGFDEWLADLAAVAEEGTDRLQAVWKASKPEFRQHLTSTYPKNWDALKALASKASQPVSA